MAKLFYLTTKRHGGNYYVQFRLEDGSLSNQKSTGTSNYDEAQKIAYTWLANGNIPARINSKTPDKAQTANLSVTEYAMNILMEAVQASSAETVSVKETA